MSSAAHFSNFGSTHLSSLPSAHLQVFGDALAIPAVVTAMMGLCTLLSTGVLNWRDCLTYTAAWDTLFWFASERKSACYEAALP